MEPRCPICQRPVEASARTRGLGPFCSARCRDVDLGRWLDGAYRIPTTDVPSEDELASALGAEEARRRA